VEIKCQLDATDEFLLQILGLAQHVSGTIMPIIRSSRVLYKWMLPVVFSAWFSSCGYGVELGVVCPVCSSPQTGHTTPSSTPIKIHLLHLVGILFPHNIDDAWSKPHQTVHSLLHDYYQHVQCLRYTQKPLHIISQRAIKKVNFRCSNITLAGKLRNKDQQDALFCPLDLFQ
jgi:hypothetical protein